MATVDLKLPHHQYTIHIQPGLLSELGNLSLNVANHDRATIIADDAIESLHLPAAKASMLDAGYKEVLTCTINAGEHNKNLTTMQGLYDQLLDARMERMSPIIALGGGVIGDTVGFVAASYLRGVPFIQCPTTLLSMVDASVGGKVGVNVPQGKNLIGAFYQPNAVVIDTDTLKTLPRRELICGLAECVKHGLICDEELFDWIESNAQGILALDSDTLVELVRRNVQIKAAIVMEDEKEAGIRAHLNFGHTFAHAIEATQKYTDQGSHHHGEAVALGMVAATRLAVDAGMCESHVLDRLLALQNLLGLPTSANNLADNKKLLQTMHLDKKVKDGAIRLVLPVKMGKVVIDNTYDDQAICNAWDSLRVS
ncbi:3-dehydroquinate synthase [bacterium AH-315-I18]|nr:3-dehydroquinate synthase [bacterium AH-315-I18]